MKLIKSLLMISMLFSLISCQETLTDEQWLAKLPTPWTLTQEQMNEILPQFQQRFPDFQNRIKQIALWRVGTPYEIFKLGEEAEPDLDPIIRYDVSDCTGHNLTSLAAARSSSWEEARENMIKLHYKADSNGVKQPTYRSRWHYTVDRITLNPNTVDITQTLLPKAALDSINITLNQKEDGEEFLDLDWNRTMTAYYIPNHQITPALLAKLPTIVGVTFVKPKYFKMGIVMGHEGMIIDGKYLVHASQSAGETVKLDFLKYYFPEEDPFFGGIMIFEFKEHS
ncbi:MAG: DUF1460 domain-containing protein [Candidatus Marinimicrobia bacterium]|jgi:hypothetical protein|nr:DUF1460 domain-containing protein [Candidatus Neomarinimicrobiota bacterium]MBT4715656.1 DUF1460 domain-containing protein [Candidatus Neomarinimicrobiota bacterium]MBT6009880.1 DUF1460 domain-containing protein [Candidatus Neomarinimicrobiota bacterium]